MEEEEFALQALQKSNLFNPQSNQGPSRLPPVAARPMTAAGFP
jgi:hypothetical protein